MTDLKTKIARGEYEIDSCAVAEAIVSKLRTVSRVRAQLETTRKARASRRFEHPATMPAERRGATC